MRWEEPKRGSLYERQKLLTLIFVKNEDMVHETRIIQRRSRKSARVNYRNIYQSERHWKTTLKCWKMCLFYVISTGFLAFKRVVIDWGNGGFWQTLFHANTFDFESLHPAKLWQRFHCAHKTEMCMGTCHFPHKKETKPVFFLSKQFIKKTKKTESKAIWYFFSKNRYMSQKSGPDFYVK